MALRGALIQVLNGVDQVIKEDEEVDEVAQEQEGAVATVDLTGDEGQEEEATPSTS
jgi:hypothetical protein